MQPSISTATLHSQVWGAGERLLISVMGNKGQHHGNAVGLMRMADMKDNERWISQNWLLDSLEWHRKREVREESRPEEWLLPETGSRRRVWARGKMGQEK